MRARRRSYRYVDAHARLRNKVDKMYKRKTPRGSGEFFLSSLSDDYARFADFRFAVFFAAFFATFLWAFFAAFFFAAIKIFLLCKSESFLLIRFYDHDHDHYSLLTSMTFIHIHTREKIFLCVDNSKIFFMKNFYQIFHDISLCKCEYFA